MYPRLVSPGEDIRVALCADQINAIVERLPDGGSKKGSASTVVSDRQPGASAVDSKIDWMMVILPCKTGTYPLALEMLGAKHIIRFSGVIAGATASLSGALVDVMPAAFSAKTGSFSVEGRVVVKRSVVGAAPSISALAIVVTAIPATDKPAYLYFQVGFAR
jgi:hypothetical protein